MPKRNSEWFTPPAYKAGAEGAKDSRPASTDASEGTSDVSDQDFSLWGPGPDTPEWAKYSPYPVNEEAAEMFAMGHVAEAARLIIGPPAPEDLPKPSKRGRGRPRGRNFDKVSITLERPLLQRVDDAASEQKSSRSAVISQLIKRGLGGSEK